MLFRCCSCFAGEGGKRPPSKKQNKKTRRQQELLNLFFFLFSFILSTKIEKKQVAPLPSRARREVTEHPRHLQDLPPLLQLLDQVRNE